MDAIERAFEEGEIVLVDDLQLITAVVQSYDYARPNLLEALLTGPPSRRILASIVNIDL